MYNLFKYSILFLIVTLFSVTTDGQDIPAPMSPPRLINDFAGILKADEISALENKLVAFNDSTSSQITVVLVKSLNGFDQCDLAQRIGQKWGAGQKGKNNGIVILVKPKYDNDKGQTCIQTGYGLESVLPDITCKRIVEHEMIPEFQKNNYYAGLDKAITTIISITKGEFTADQYNKRTKAQPYGIFVPILILIFIILWIRSNRGGTHSVGKSLPFWTALWLMGSMGSGGRGNWGDFRSGGGSFGGGGGGGFGGFGGGGFGGGGAGGSW
ncbi:MAG: TPM domain-containing protein [Bacteroidetes bacterium]|nr:TPM domain-containing protein [Bacteroidota bacterium]